MLLDVVANARNGIDVDKLEYIRRDSRACGIAVNSNFDVLLSSIRVLLDPITSLLSFLLSWCWVSGWCLRSVSTTALLGLCWSPQ